eukprot:TRINITY_DN43364_c0_g1_i1.p1 TRINITY_DN43364_c0_g1~~TRINITY_DN43364_c0_g1_i1.p1  ORF type:complete len:107 (+),score=5.51 TRINITY_DN43364_c0_g1_i1:41-361(+)
MGKILQRCKSVDFCCRQQRQTKCRLVVVTDALQALLKHQDLSPRIPLLIFANKRDLPTAMTPDEIAQELNISQITARPWRIFPSSAMTGEGLTAGTDWLAEQIRKQ